MDESEIPIDIHTNKLMDWLISRRHVPRDWQTKMLEIRQKINEAIKDMPVHADIATLLSGSYINYYHCQQIIKILEKTESESKNFFGQYGSQRMKDWKEVMRLYERDNVYLGEVASLLLRNVNFEIPALKRQIQKVVQQRADYEKKEIEYEKQANNVKNEINASFKELGIPGKKIRIELLQKATELPKINKKIADDARKLNDSAAFYRNAVAALTDSTPSVLKTLQLVIDKGDVTVYEYRTGSAPTRVEEITIDLKKMEEENEEDAIDFGEDLDLDISSGGDIDWGISTDDAVISDKKTEAGVARDTDARTILGHTETRTAFTNDLLELEAFLKLRQHELKAEDNLPMSMLPDALLAADGKQVADMLATTQAVLQSVNNPSAINFFNINTNPTYVDQLTKKLNNKLETLEKLQVAKSVVHESKLDTTKEQQAIEPKVTLLFDRTRQLQDQIEVDISKRYNGRPVNLMGGINVLTI